MFFPESSMGAEQATHATKAVWAKQTTYNTMQNVWRGTYPVSSEELLLNTQ